MFPGWKKAWPHRQATRSQRPLLPVPGIEAIQRTLGTTLWDKTRKVSTLPMRLKFPLFTPNNYTSLALFRQTVDPSGTLLQFWISARFLNRRGIRNWRDVSSRFTSHRTTTLKELRVVLVAGNCFWLTHNFTREDFHKKWVYPWRIWVLPLKIFLKVKGPT